MVLGVSCTLGHRCREVKVPTSVRATGLLRRAALLGVALPTGEILGLHEILHDQFNFFLLVTVGLRFQCFIVSFQLISFVSHFGQVLF